MRGLILLLLFLLPPGLVAANDFQLEVPVEAEQLIKTVAYLQVTCQVLAGEERVIGEGREQVRVQERAFAGTVAVHFDAEPGRDPSAADNYRCQLRLRDASGFRYYLPQVDDADDLPIWARPRDDSELVAEVTGPLESTGNGADGAADEADGEAPEPEEEA